MSTTRSSKVALITGGNSGIGRATAIAFAREGARVVIAARNAERGQEVVREIAAAGGEAAWIQCDVAQVTQVQALVEETVARYGRLDYAFNNAGSGGRGNWLADVTEEDWDKTIDGYLKSVWACMKYEIAVMLKAGGGTIVNNSSADGERGFPWDPVYSAAKHGVLGLTKSAAQQYGRQGVRINAICPGWVRTPPVERMLERDPEAEGRMLAHQPIGRLGTAEEVAEAVVWLCSDKASFILGTALAVDGGYLTV